MLENGIVSKRAKHSVEETLSNLEELLKTRGISIFARIDHSGEAEKVGMHMPATKLLIFGNPKGGTPMMLAAPSLALDLPMKILIAEDPQGQVWVSYNAPGYLAERHGLPLELRQNLLLIESLAASVAGG